MSRMLSENLNTLVSALSGQMQSCDMYHIGRECMRVANHHTIDMDAADYETAHTLERIASEPLDDKLSLHPMLFAAQNTIQARRLELLNLERYHADRLRERKAIEA